MRLLVQRVSKAAVEIEGEITAQIGKGILVFVGIGREDQKEDSPKWVDKLLKLRLFPDEAKPINRSIQDVNGEVLLVSQFTLYGDTRGQNRPSFIRAAPPEQAEVLYEHFVSLMKSKWPRTQTGRFAAHMSISLINDGPVTLLLE